MRMARFQKRRKEGAPGHQEVAEGGNQPLRLFIYVIKKRFKS